jgi:nicotinamidase-related amidase
LNKNTALIIIDVQEDMFSNPHYPLYKGGELLNNVGSLIDSARSSNVPVIYIQHTENDDEPMGKGKHGWYIHHQIAPLKDDVVILKYTPDSFHQTNLHEFLSSKNISKIVIAGLQTDYCIDTTCRRAYSLGYETVLVQDAHSTFDSDTLSAEQIIAHHNRILGSWFAKLVPCEQISFN